MKSDIGLFSKFKNKLELGRYFDLETPYGYGGPLSDTGFISDESQQSFLKEFSDYCKSNRIISQFVRFHPLLNNHLLLPDVIESRVLKETIYIDTSSPDLIWSNLDSKNRNMIRKARKSGITIQCVPIEDYEDFVPFYNETMVKDSADDYYFLDNEYFESQKKLNNNSCVFYAVLDGKPISGAIFYYNSQFMHYHLAGTHTEFRRFAPNNLLLYEAACWASEKGIKKLHLGGGIVADDNLFRFKKQFNKNGRLPFVIGRTVFDKNAYNELIGIRKDLDIGFSKHNAHMIQYRA